MRATRPTRSSAARSPRSLETAKLELRKLKDIAVEHSRLIAENRIYIDVVASYTFRNLPPEEQLRALESGDFDRVLSGQDKKALRDDLKRFVLAKQISSVTGDVAAIASALAKSGLLNEKQANVVATAASYIAGLGGVAASIMTANPVGIITGVLGLIGLASGGTESPELQMLKRLDAKLDQIQAGIEVLDKKLNALAQFTERAYQNLASALSAHHAFVAAKFELLDYELQHVARVTALNLTQDLKQCTARPATRPSSYADYVERFSVSGAVYVNPCLTGLAKVVTTPADFASIYLEQQTNAPATRQKWATELVRETYEPAREALCRFRGLPEAEADLPSGMAIQRCLESPSKDSLIRSVASMQVPAAQLHGRAPIAQAVEAAKLPDVDVARSLGPLLDPQMIVEVGDAFLFFYPYFEIQKGTGTFQPAADIHEYLSLPRPVRDQRRQELERFLERLIGFANVSIAQQVLLSGAPMMERMFQTLFSVGATPAERDVVIKMLQRNPIAAHNFAVWLLQVVFGVDAGGVPRECRDGSAESCYDVLVKNYGVALDAKSKPEDVAAALRNLDSAGAPYGLRFRTERGALFVKLPEYASGAGTDVSLIVPAPEWLVNDRILYPEPLYSVLAMKERLLGELVSVSAPRYLGTSGSDVRAEHYVNLILQ